MIRNPDNSKQVPNTKQLRAECEKGCPYHQGTKSRPGPPEPGETSTVNIAVFNTMFPHGSPYPVIGGNTPVGRCTFGKQTKKLYKLPKVLHCGIGTIYVKKEEKVK